MGLWWLSFGGGPAVIMLKSKGIAGGDHVEL
jgi:hypothetical protein